MASPGQRSGTRPCVMRALLPIALLAAPVLFRIPAPTVSAQEELVIPGELQPAPEHAPAPVIPLEEVPDERLTERIRAVFTEIEEFEGISVAVNRGVATLSGMAASQSARQEAAALASRFEGVLYVENSLELDPEVQTRVAPVMVRLRRLSQRFVTFLPVLGIAIALVAVFWTAGSLVGRVEFLYRHLSPLRAYLVRTFLKLAIVLTGIVLAVTVLDVAAVAGAVAGTAGVIGIALGFAFKDIVQNYLAGFLLSMRSPFTVNDLVRIDEYEGRVVRLTARELVLLTLDGNQILIPNSRVFGTTVSNFTRNPRRRMDFIVPVDRKADLTEIARIGVTTLRAMKGVRAEPGPFMWVDRILEMTVEVRFHCWVDQRSVDWFKARSEAMRLVVTALTGAGVTVPDPLIRIRLQKAVPAQAEAAVSAGQPAGVLSEAQRERETGERLERVRHSAEEADVAPDDELERQVRESLERGEENLLEQER